MPGRMVPRQESSTLAKTFVIKSRCRVFLAWEDAVVAQCQQVWPLFAFVDQWLFASGLVRPLSLDSARRWGIGYGADVAVPLHYTSHVVVQQAFVEAPWLHGVLSVGAKEYPLELKNQTLSSGSQTLGINARPVPQVRLALPEYWTIPAFGRWLQLKGHVAFGMMTDDNWQKDFTHCRTKYAEHVLYHSKAGFLRIGNEDRFCPWSLELGLEMAAEFGGNVYHRGANGEMVQIPYGQGL